MFQRTKGKHNVIGLSVIPTVSCLDPVSQVQETKRSVIFVLEYRYMVILLFATTRRRLSMQTG